MMLSISIFAAELLVEKSGIACATLLEKALELSCHLWIEYVTCLLEGCKRICIQHGCPCVAIVASRIACGEDVVVESRTIASDNLWNHLHVLHRSLFECVYIKCVGGGHLMVVHIEDRSREKLSLYKTLIEGACLVDLSHQLLRDEFACLVVERIGFQYLWVVAVVLHELRWELHEITWGVSTSKRLVGSFRKQAMECVTELVEEGLYIVHRK